MELASPGMKCSESLALLELRVLCLSEVLVYLLKSILVFGKDVILHVGVDTVLHLVDKSIILGEVELHISGGNIFCVSDQTDEGLDH